VPKPTRTCVFDLHHGVVNVNDAIGLDAHSSYTIEEFLEDVERYEGRRVSQAGLRFIDNTKAVAVKFNDGTEAVLVESEVEVPAEVLVGLGHGWHPVPLAGSEDFTCANPR
jgi:hypothetical protein